MTGIKRCSRLHLALGLACVLAVTMSLLAVGAPSIAGREQPVVAAYPAKPEAPAPPRPGTFSNAATEAARAVLRGRGIYLCNEVIGIDGPQCAGGVPRSDADLIASATGLGLSALWVRCGDSRRGFPAEHRAALDRLRPQAHAAGLSIVCWDVPNFWDIPGDARRLAEMAAHADAVASDLESGHDNVDANGHTEGGGYAGPTLQSDKGKRWASAYGGWVRHHLDDVLAGAGADYPLVVLTMQPQTHGAFPFEELASAFNVFSPMLYRGVTWFENDDPGLAERPKQGNPFVAEALRILWSRGLDPARHHIVVTGMAYAGTGLRAHENQIARDMQAAADGGALGFSAFVYQAVIDHPPWADAMRAGNHWAPPPPPPPPAPEPAPAAEPENNISSEDILEPLRAAIARRLRAGIPITGL